MKGVSQTIVNVLLILLVITISALLLTQFRKISTETESKGNELMVDARIAPKVLGVSCGNTSGYAIISVDLPITVPVYYEVTYGFEEVASGFSNTNISDVGNIYFNATMEDGKEYKLKVSSQSWSFEEYCVSTYD